MNTVINVNDPKYKHLSRHIKIFFNGDPFDGVFEIVGSDQPNIEVDGELGIFDPYPPIRDPETNSAKIARIQGKVMWKHETV